jgi:two-component system sensor histidine kinase SenX3
VPLSDLVGDVLRDWRERHPERDFRRRIGKNLPAVLADQRMLHRCLDELLDNAIKFSPGGEPVTISANLEVASAQRLVRVTVRDRGVGIDPDTRSRVFHDFYQADASETRQYGGLGLGLALVRRIVDGLGGDVVVESDPGRGSVFSLLLPVADVAPLANGHKGPDSP